jgi:Heterokaryon incompatibility protein (HET)
VASELIHCNLDNFSLNDYTTQFRVYKSAVAVATSYQKPLIDWDPSWMPKGWKGDKNKVASDPAILSHYTWGDYAALSYAWGDMADTVDAVVNGTVVKITRNLEGALQMLRRTGATGKKKHWVDALCINQNDLVERGHQVRRMRDIFGVASEVMVWIGEASSDSHKAIDLISTIWEKYQSIEQIQQLTDLLQRNPEALSVGVWKAYYELINRAYWGRLWILQELAISGNGLRIFWGEKYISLRKFRHTAWVFNNQIDILSNLIKKDLRDSGLSDTGVGLGVELHIWRIDRLVRLVGAGRRGAVCLGPMLSLGGLALTTDPRDKVYGLLGLMDLPISSQIIPDYTLPVAEVFIGFVIAVIKASRKLDIIRSADTFTFREIPSWIPDLRFPIMYRQYQYFTSGKSNASVKYSKDGRSITCKGCWFDTIDGLGQCADHTQRYAPVDSRSDQDALFQSVNERNPYRAEAGLKEAIWKTLVCAHTKARRSHPVGSITLTKPPTPASWSSLCEIPWLWRDQTMLGEINKGGWKLICNRPWYRQFARFREENKNLKIAGRPFHNYFPRKVPNARIRKIL